MERTFDQIKHMISNDTGGSYDIRNNSKYRDFLLSTLDEDDEIMGTEGPDNII